MQETQVQSLGWEVPLGKERATHSSILAWDPTDRLAWLQYRASQRVSHYLVTKQSILDVAFAFESTEFTHKK